MQSRQKGAHVVKETRPYFAKGTSRIALEELRVRGEPIGSVGGKNTLNIRKGEGGEGHFFCLGPRGRRIC